MWDGGKIQSMSESWAMSSGAWRISGLALGRATTRCACCRYSSTCSRSSSVLALENRQYGAIQRAIAQAIQQGTGSVLLRVQQQPRSQVEQVLPQGVQGRRGHVGDEANAQSALPSFAHAFEFPQQRLVVGDGEPCPGDHDLAGSRRLQAAPRAQEKRLHEDVLDVGEGPRDRRLAQGQLPGDARHRAMTVESQQEGVVPHLQAVFETWSERVGRMHRTKCIR